VASTPSPYPGLFSPIQIGSRRLRNRVVLPATVTNYGVGNRITDRWTSFLVERARGGAAMVITEVIAVDPDAVAQGSIIKGFDDANLAGFAGTAEQCERAGSALVAQLWHPGRQQLWLPGASPKGVSDQPDAYSWTVPHVMTTGEVERVAEAYVNVAVRLKECGLAGVELHGAHGYLISQFLSPWSNSRTDRFGGSVENRCRFAVEIAAEIRRRCGPDFVIGLKIPGREGVPGGIDPDEACRITAELVRHKLLDYLAVNQGNFSLSLEEHVPDLYFRPGHFLDIHRQIHQHTAGTPLMAIGRINTPELAESVISSGTAELVGLCRAMISDAAFAAKAAAGRGAEIRPSVFDNQAWGEIHVGKSLEEPQNPMLGRPGEADWTPAPASAPRRIVVVGAGPGGLEAAWLAAARGHHVRLISAGHRIGGRYAAEAALPDRRELGRLLDYYDALLDRHGVTRDLGRRLAPEDVEALDADAVVLATGADQRRPGGIGADHPDALSGQDWLKLHEEGAQPAVEGRRVALFDQDHSATTYALADRLVALGARVTLLTPRTQLARNVNYCSAIGVFRRLFGGGVEMVYGVEIDGFEGGRLRLRNAYSGTASTVEDVALLIYSTPRKATDALAEPLRRKGRELHLIGDCQSPRNLFAAIHEGHAVAKAL